MADPRTIPRDRPPEAVPSAYETARVQFDAVTERMGLEPGVREFLRTPGRELSVRLPVRMDNGEV